MEVVYGQNGPAAGLGKQSLPVGVVVKDKGLGGQPPTEVGAKEGQYPVFGGDLTGQYAADVREAYEAGEQVGLVVQMLHRPAHPVHRGVGQMFGDGGALLISQLNEAPQPQFFVLQAGEEPPGDHVLPWSAEFLLKGAKHSLGVALVGDHGALRVQGAQRAGIRTEVYGSLPVHIGLVDAGEKACIAAVVAVGDLRPAHKALLRGGAGGSNRDSCCP